MVGCRFVALCDCTAYCCVVCAKAQVVENPDVPFPSPEGVRLCKIAHATCRYVERPEFISFAGVDDSEMSARCWERYFQSRPESPTVGVSLREALLSKVLNQMWPAMHMHPWNFDLRDPIILSVAKTWHKLCTSSSCLLSAAENSVVPRGGGRERKERNPATRFYFNASCALCSLY